MATNIMRGKMEGKLDFTILKKRFDAIDGYWEHIFRKLEDSEDIKYITEPSWANGPKRLTVSP